MIRPTAVPQGPVERVRPVRRPYPRSDVDQTQDKSEALNGNAGNSMSGRLRSAVGYALVGVFAALCGYYVFTHRTDFLFVTRISFPATAAAALVVLPTYAVNAYQLSLFLRKFGLELGIVELIALSSAMILGNMVIPMRGGSGGMAVYLKKVHGLDFRRFAAIYAGSAILLVLINTSMAGIVLVLLAWLHGFVHEGLTLLVAVMFLGCLYLTLFPPPMKWKRGGLLGAAFDAGHSWHLLTRDRRLLIRLSACMFVMALCVTAAFFLIYRALGTPLSPSGALVTTSMGNIANLVPITPGSLGIFDAVVIQVPQMFGMDPARSIAGTLVFRVLSFFWAIVLGIPGMLYIVRFGRER